MYVWHTHTDGTEIGIRLQQTGRQASSLMVSIHVALLLPMLDFASGWKHSFAVYGIASAFGREIPDCILFTSRCTHVGL